MKKLVRYSVIRFMPFAETQEFANVGIVIHAPQLGRVLFKLADKRFGRVTQFFEDLEGKLYSNAVKLCEAELNRVKEYSSSFRGKELADFMDEVTRPREGFITYSETAALLTDAKLEDKLIELYDGYVGRSFNTKERREAVLAQNLKRQLRKISRYPFERQKIKADYFAVDLPLVATDDYKTKAIKPLSFQQKTPLKIIDHGEKWIARVKRLITHGAFDPQNFLFAIDRPEFEGRVDLSHAYESLACEMNSLGVSVCDVNNTEELASFARFESELSSKFELIS